MKEHYGPRPAALAASGCLMACAAPPTLTTHSHGACSVGALRWLDLCYSQRAGCARCGAHTRKFCSARVAGHSDGGKAMPCHHPGLGLAGDGPPVRSMTVPISRRQGADKPGVASCAIPTVSVA